MEKSFQSTVNETRDELNSIAGSLDDPTSSSSPPSSSPEPQTDWDRIYAVRRTRDRLRDRRLEREKSLGVRRPKRR